MPRFLPQSTPDELNDFEERFASMTCRSERQAFYLSCLQCLAPEEEPRFFRIYNELASKQAISSRVGEWVEAEKPGGALHRLARHFVGLFDVWLTSRNQRDVIREDILFTALEDINVTAIAFKSRRGLCYGRRLNHNLKAIKYDAVHCSAN